MANHRRSAGSVCYSVLSKLRSRGQSELQQCMKMGMQIRMIRLLLRAWGTSSESLKSILNR